MDDAVLNLKEAVFNRRFPQRATGQLKTPRGCAEARRECPYQDQPRKRAPEEVRDNSMPKSASLKACLSLTTTP